MLFRSGDKNKKLWVISILLLFYQYFTFAMIVKHLKSEIIKESMGGGVEEDEERGV